MALSDLLIVIGTGGALAALAAAAHLAHRRAGLVPLVALLTILATAVPAFSWQRSLPLPDALRASSVSLAVVPTLIVATVAVYFTHGGRTARGLALLPAALGPIVAVAAAVRLPVPLLPPPEGLATTPGGAVFIGAIVTLCALAGTAAFAAIARYARNQAPAFATVAGGFAGVLLYVLIVSASAQFDGPILPGTTLGRAFGPLVAATPVSYTHLTLPTKA